MSQRASQALRTRQLVTGGLLVALLASSAWISVPIEPVPITLQVCFVVLAALLLAPGIAVAATSVYVLLGAAGAPVFAGGRAGLGILFGPTGGFLFGFVAGAAIGAVTRALLLKARVREPLANGCAAAATVVVIYLLGWVQLMLVMDMSPAAAFAAGVAPFVVFDIAKAAVAVGVAMVLARGALAEHAGR